MNAALIRRVADDLRHVFAGDAELDALTVWQAWAWAIVAGHKPIENRDWPPPPQLSGRWLAIHAGARVDRGSFDTIAILCGGVRPRMIRSAIVGLARVSGVLRGSPPAGSAEAMWRSETAFAWRFDAVLELEHAIPCGGAERLWHAPRHVVATLADQLGVGPEASRCCAHHPDTYQRCVKPRGHELDGDPDHGPAVVHTCHARGCDEPCPPERLMCPAHWKMVPKEVQAAVWKHYRVGQCDDRNPSKAWHRAADAAIRAVAELELERARKKEAQAISREERRTGVDRRQLGLGLGDE